MSKQTPASASRASTISSTVPPVRIRELNAAQVQADGDYVLYWMIAARRSTWNFALERAVDWARELRKPLIVFEPLRCGYQWASDRLHAFVIQGMLDNAAAFARKPVTYFPYLEQQAGAGSGLLAALAKDACLVVTDEYPCFFLPQMTAAAAGRCGVRMEAIDSNGLCPLGVPGKAFSRAFDFRNFLRRNLRPHLDEFPQPDPLHGVKLPRLKALPAGIAKRWPAAKLPERESDFAALLKSLPLDYSVPPAAFRGGATAAQATLDAFLDKRLARYGDDRNQPDAKATSRLSPYLHFGHISAHQVAQAVIEREDWTPDVLNVKPDRGASRLWIQMSEPADGFLDQLVTWRELGFNCCRHVPNYDHYKTLPTWAQQTLAEHAGDKREHIYSLEQFETACTHDEIWNAAQRQLAQTGEMHNYLRMLWGKKILEWTPAPQDALRVMIELNNKYAIDGRDPNSYTGIFWVLGRFDRAWGPERPIYGKIRYMSSDNTRRKLKLDAYLEEFGETSSGRLF